MLVKRVAPYMGAWIETIMPTIVNNQSKVAPYMGAWIETLLRNTLGTDAMSRTLHGCVD